MKALKMMRIFLAVILAANTVHAEGTIKIEVTRQAQEQDKHLSLAVSEYFRALEKLSAARLKEIQVTALQNEYEKSGNLVVKKNQEYQNLLQQMSRANQGELPSLDAKKRLVEDELHDLRRVQTGYAIQLSKFFYDNYYENYVDDWKNSVQYAARLVARKEQMATTAKMHLVRRVSAGNQQAFLKQLGQYEESKKAWVQSQLLLQQIDELNGEIYLLDKKDFKNPVLVKKYGKISEEPAVGLTIAVGFVTVFLSMFAIPVLWLDKAPLASYAFLAGALILAGVAYYTYYKRTPEGSDIQRTFALVNKKIASVREELIKINVELEASTKDMELIIESTQ